VAEPSGAVVADAQIQFTNTATRAIYKATTSAAGEYTFAQVTPGTYELSVAEQRIRGYQAYQRKGISVTAAQTLLIDVRLELNPGLGTLGEGGVGFASKGEPPSGPAPRMPDGKPDLSGVWTGPGGRPTEPMLPWAATLTKKRQEENNKDNPNVHCMPDGYLRLGLFKLVQTPSVMIMILQDEDPGYHQIFLDGRDHPKDVNPTWYGHSIGKWDGDTLTVDVIGFNGKRWLAVQGYPATERLHVIERYRRPDLGHLEVETTIDDPGVFEKPWTMKRVATLAVDDEIMEYVCNENNRDEQHIVGK
jgi:hypothetical protein